jgi:hypothetical protein
MDILHYDGYFDTVCHGLFKNLRWSSRFRLSFAWLSYWLHAWTLFLSCLKTNSFQPSNNLDEKLIGNFIF